MNAVERMVEYTSQATEGAAQKSAWPPPRDWPHAGGITIDNLQVLLFPEVYAVVLLGTAVKNTVRCIASSRNCGVPNEETMLKYFTCLTFILILQVRCQL